MDQTENFGVAGNAIYIMAVDTHCNALILRCADSVNNETDAVLYRLGMQGEASLLCPGSDYPIYACSGVYGVEVIGGGVRRGVRVVRI
jgi:hypothetical protein